MSENLEKEEVQIADHKYLVTHVLDENGQRSGKGWIEQEESINLGDDFVTKKWRRTGATYQAFLAKLALEQEKQNAQKEHDEAIALLTRTRRETPQLISQSLTQESELTQGTPPEKVPVKGKQNSKVIDHDQSALRETIAAAVGEE